MKSFRLARLIGLIDDDLVAESDEIPVRKKIHWLRYTALAACLCVMLAGVWKITHIRAGSAAPEEPSAAEPAEDAPTVDGDAGIDGSHVFTSYAGPIFPLTLDSEQPELTAEREIVCDFSPYSDDESYVHSVAVTDSYVITNSGTEDIECTAMYPFVSSLYSLEENIPSMAVNGESTEAPLLAGSYAGGFTGAGDETTSSMNLSGPNGWSDYSDVLSDGGYLAGALAELPELREKVIVYHITNGTPPEDCDAATVCMSFDYDSEKSQIFTFDMNGYGEDDETGNVQYSYSAKEWNKNGAYLVVIGDDIGEFTLQGYKNGGCYAGQEIDFEYGAERTEMTLGEFLYTAVERQRKTLETMYGHYENVTVPDADIYYRAVADLWLSYGPMGETPAERYQMGGRIDELIDDAHVMKRICYAAVKITVPAGGSVTVTAEMSKSVSFNFFCGESDGAETEGYDLLTYTGSCLEFVKVTAGIETYDSVVIESQNMGFDLETGVDRVELDPDTEHYYIEFREKAE